MYCTAVCAVNIPSKIKFKKNITCTVQCTITGIKLGNNFLAFLFKILLSCTILCRGLTKHNVCNFETYFMPKHGKQGILTVFAPTEQ